MNELRGKNEKEQCRNNDNANIETAVANVERTQKTTANDSLVQDEMYKIPKCILNGGCDNCGNCY